jgi:hypothetical protein
VLDLIRDMAVKLLPKKVTVFIDDRLHLVEVSDGDSMDIIGHKVTFSISCPQKQSSMDSAWSSMAERCLPAVGMNR